MYKQTKNMFITSIIPALCFILLVFTGANAYALAGTPPVDKTEVPLTDPSKPATVKVGLIMGDITVTGYSGKTILVEAAVSEHQEGNDEEKEDLPKKAKGMHQIKATGSGLSVMEENNTVVIKAPSFAQSVNISLKVPYKTSLKLKTVNAGEIKVKDVEGDLDVNHVNGSITLTGVGGSVLANTTNGDLTVTFKKVARDKPMSFTSFNGDVDVTFPANAAFNLKMDTEQGEIYSDFQLKLQAPPAKSEKQAEKDKKSGKFVVTFDKSVYGLLNGGGEEVRLKTFNGDIYIRKGK